MSDDKRFIGTGGYRGTIAVYDRFEETWEVSRPTISGLSCIAFDIENYAFKISSYDGRVYSMNLKDFRADRNV